MPPKIAVGDSVGVAMGALVGVLLLSVGGISVGSKASMSTNWKYLTTSAMFDDDLSNAINASEFEPINSITS